MQVVSLVVGLHLFLLSSDVALALTDIPRSHSCGPTFGAVPEQSTAWIFTAWTNGFALLALIAVFLEDRFSDHYIAPNRVQRAIATALCAVLATVVIVTLAVAKLELPALVTQNGFTPLSLSVRWLSIILLCAGICLILFVMREPSDLYLWLSWALTAMVFYTCPFHRRGGTLQCWLVYRTA